MPKMLVVDSCQTCYMSTKVDDHYECWIDKFPKSKVIPEPTEIAEFCPLPDAEGEV